MTQVNGRWIAVLSLWHKDASFVTLRKFIHSSFCYGSLIEHLQNEASSTGS
jgi:hypothetical protein